MGRGMNQPTRRRFDRIVRARPPPPGDESTDESEEEVDQHLQDLFRQRNEIATMVRNIHQGTEEAAVIQGCMSALECLLFERPPPVEHPEEYAVEQTRWAMSHPRFLNHLQQIRVAFREVIPAGDLFTAMIKHKLERVLRGAETLTVVTIQCHINQGDQDPPGPSPPGPSPPGPSAGHPGPLAGPSAANPV